MVGSLRLYELFNLMQGIDQLRAERKAANDRANKSAY
jgi:hypothetical protein